ncbi:MAG TPA: sensor domain-containing protein [Thermoleophilia bacterium]|nr:sensor domain-containing protein [Thermoleophilia bacterium]
MSRWLSRFFGVVAQSRTWLNAVYLWLSFPLGLFYFVFLTVGLSLGVSLVVIWVGIPILLVVVGAWWLFGAFERAQAGYLLGFRVTPSPRSWETDEGIWAKLKGHFVSAATWKDLVFLFAKLPLGIVSFTLSVTAVATTISLLVMPLFWYFDVAAVNGAWVPPLWAAIVAVPAGVLSFFVWLHILNAWAWVCGKWAQVVFGSAPPSAVPRVLDQWNGSTGEVVEGER